MFVHDEHSVLGFANSMISLTIAMRKGSPKPGHLAGMQVRT